MNLTNSRAEIFVPDGADVADALGRTTQMAVGAHPDDIPIMAQHGILECLGKSDKWFLAVTVTDGAGSPRSGPYAGHTDEQMRDVRNAEEKKAASLGEFGAAVLLDYPSPAVRNSATDDIVADLANIVDSARPDVLYTHNLADKHDTHVAVGLRTLAALRRLPMDARPSRVYGCEVWRDLDWMSDNDKVVFDVSARQDIAAGLLRIYDSQIAGGKRYDLAAAGRRLAHATFSESRGVDTAQALIYGMDLTPLVKDVTIDPSEYVNSHILKMSGEISNRIASLSGGNG